MKILICVICVVLIVSIKSQQQNRKIKEARCKLQCVNKTVSLCYTEEECQCRRNLIPNRVPIEIKHWNNELILKCKSEDMIVLEWNNNELNILNKNLPSAYYLQVKSDKNEFFTDVTLCNYHSVQGLLPNTSYEIRLWSVDIGFNVFVSKSLNIRTNERNRLPLPISNISVDLIPSGMKYEAHIHWSPATDLACYYEIVLFCTKTRNSFSVVPAAEIHDIILPTELFHLHIKELHFGYNYELTIRSRGTLLENESEIKNVPIYVPTCLETYRNLTICEPTKPKNLTIVETPTFDEDGIGNSAYDIHLHWLRPQLMPDYYIATLDISYTERPQNDPPMLIIPGDKDSATFAKVNLTSYYQVYLQAVSAGGRSPAALVNRFYILPKYPSWKHEKVYSSKTLLVGVGILALISFFGVLTIPVRRKNFNLFRYKQEEKYERHSKIKEEIEYTKENQVVEASDEWELSSESLHFQSVLGEGAFGIVWYALLNEKPVACKTLKENSTADEKRQIQQEIEIMKNVGSHPNIVSIIGCVTQGVTNGPILIVEHCSMGDLLTYLRTIYDHTSKILNEYFKEVNHEDRDFINKSYELNINESEAQLCLSHEDVLSFGKQISLGMEYLSNQKVLHRDLAARNILMCDKKSLKVSDFGLSRDVYMDSVYKTTGGRLPIRWMAPESLTRQIYTTQSDVWSFGILLWEIVSLGAIPYPGIETSELLEFLKRGDRMTKPQYCPDDVYSIMKDCWKESPNDRPTFRSLKKSFDLLLTSETDYLEINKS